MTADDSPGLAGWLSARYDEAERAARAATPGPWRVDDESYAEAVHSADGTAVVAGGRWGDEAPVFEETADALHIAALDPSWRLDDIARKRAILAEHDDQHECTDLAGSAFPYVGCRTVRLLAAEFESAPGYGDVWRP